MTDPNTERSHAVTERFDPIPVRRVEHDGGSHIEPPLPDKADDLTALRWHAGALEADTGIRVTIARFRHRIGRTTYALSSPVAGISAMSCSDLWAYINGMSHGAEAARRLDGREAK